MTAGADTQSEFKRGWPVVLTSMIGIGLGLSPVPFYTTGIFAPHLAKAFGWSIGAIMGGISVTALMVLWAGPLAGFLADRFGARRVALSSVVLFALSIMAFAFSTGSLVLYYANWAVASAVGAGTLPITWTRAINSQFVRRRGMALGLSLTGTGVFGIVSKPLVTWFIAALGWRGAYIALGLLPLLIAFPVGYALFRDPADPSGKAGAAPTAARTGLTFGEAIREWRFWLLAIALLPISFALAGPLPNMENILIHHGFSTAKIIQLTSLIGLSALSGRLIGGVLLDRFWAPAVAVVILLLPGVSCWILAQPGLSYGQALISIGLIGVAVGVEYDLMAYLIVSYFGLRSYPSIYGVIYVFYSLGAGLGPMAFGFTFDRTGSYSLILYTAFAALAVGAVSLLTLGRYRRFSLPAGAAG